MQVETTDNTNGKTLLLRASEAAKLLGISRKTLWNYTAKDGKNIGDNIPAVRIGRVLRYRPETFARWVSEREAAARRDETG